MTQSTSFSPGKAPVQVLPRLSKRQAAETRPPLFGSVVVSGGDQVHFGSHGTDDTGSKKGVPKKSTKESTRTTRTDGVDPSLETDASTSAKEKTSPGTKKESQSKPKKPEYGYFQNNLRAGLGILLSDVVPIVLSLPIVGGVPGFMVAVACVPASYLAGRLGSRINKGVNPKNLNPVFRYFTEVKNVIFSDGPTSPDGHAPSAVNRLNEAADDLFNIRGLGFVGGGILNRLRTWLKPKITLSKDKGLGKFIERFTQQRSLLRAEVNIRVAKADGVKEATGAAIRGSWDYMLYSGLNTVGKGLSSSGFFLFRWAGAFMEHAGIIKIAYDALRGRNTSQQTHA